MSHAAIVSLAIEISRGKLGAGNDGERVESCDVLEKESRNEREPNCDAEDLKFKVELESKCSIFEPGDMADGEKVDKLCCDNGEGPEDCHFLEIDSDSETEPECDKE
ncbi:uncharacterized protein N7529_004721 [Penicillium soppii]|uniref:uncharacterized protein n=1 Tax=Penicillium soppii TaxID=69789 RepID=UPI002547638E|nr:uncharacterized protein N7529_004721 [Penicillium soppii]KAJ5872368.1 hypothetical protein N7529_004721 [Penicillium soppii]